MNEIVDILQVGYGPVGQMSAGLLGQYGHSVVVAERYAGLYHLSRAGRIDHEVMRMIQRLDAADDLLPNLLPVDGMDLLDADRNKLVGVTIVKWGLSGWRAHYNFYQPHVEEALDRAARQFDNVEVNLGWEVVDISPHSEFVEVTLRPTESTSAERDRRVKARYVLGADGANSFVRHRAGIEMEDFGYEGEWLVCDFEHHDPDIDLGWYNANQVLDPDRPTTAARWIGRRHSRLEFMILPDDDSEELQAESAVWRLAAPMNITPETSTLVRHAVYNFRALMARNWRDDRILLVGDAAHQMPPFMGQGLCSGLRDANNLAWKLHLVLTDRAEETLLSQYEVERRPHVAAMIEMSIGMGNLVSILDPEVAQGRNEMLKQGGPPPVPEEPFLQSGVLHRNADGSVRSGVGKLSLQARVRHRGHDGLFDDVVGGGWQIISRRPFDLALLSSEQLRTLDLLEATMTLVSPANVRGATLDIDFSYDPWFRSLDADLVVVRPDFYVFAALASVDELGQALDDLAQQLQLVNVGESGT